MFKGRNIQEFSVGDTSTLHPSEALLLIGGVHIGATALLDIHLIWFGIAFFDKKDFFQLYFFLQFLVIDTLDPEPDPYSYPDPDSLEMLNPIQLIRIHNTAFNM